MRFDAFCALNTPRLRLSPAEATAEAGRASTDEKRFDLLHLQAGELAKFIDADKLTFLFSVLPANPGKQRPGGTLTPAGNIHNVFRIDDYAIWYQYLHNAACSDQLRGFRLNAC